MAARSSTVERLAVALGCFAAGCGIPRDPEQTADAVASRGVRVGVVLEAPWACERDDQPLAGVEVALVRELALARDVDVAFTVGGETRLLAMLQRFELDLVIGGLVAGSPWEEQVGFTRPYHRSGDLEHVFAVPPGENAWTMEVEAFLAAADVDRALARGRAECERP